MTTVTHLGTIDSDCFFYENILLEVILTYFNIQHVSKAAEHSSLFRESRNGHKQT